MQSENDGDATIIQEEDSITAHNGDEEETDDNEDINETVHEKTIESKENELANEERVTSVDEAPQEEEEAKTEVVAPLASLEPDPAPLASLESTSSEMPSV